MINNNKAVTLQVQSSGGQEVGKISKQWSGFAKEYFTQADNFGVSCKCYSTVSKKKKKQNKKKKNKRRRKKSNQTCMRIQG